MHRNQLISGAFNSLRLYSQGHWLGEAATPLLSRNSGWCHLAAWQHFPQFQYWAVSL